MELSEIIRLDLTTAKETSLLEFKREWFDLDTADGKGQLAKHVLALANTVTPKEPGYIIFGVSDKLSSDRIAGVEIAPSHEQIAQVLGSHTQPPPNWRVHETHTQSRRVDVLEVMYDRFRPHYAIRDRGRLASNVVYARRGPTIGTLTMPEIENMIREKSNLISNAGALEPILSGFIELPSLNHRIVARVANMTERPIEIHTRWNVVWALDPLQVDRNGGFGGHVLYPGESLEDEKSLSHVYFRVDLEKPSRRAGFVGERWFDVTWTVHYRDEHGLFKTIEHSLRTV
jgi:hypothetical protein